MGIQSTSARTDLLTTSRRPSSARASMWRRLWAKARPDEEAGVAMVTALLAVLVVGLLGVVVFRVAVHSTDASSFTSKTGQAVHTAEAGLDVATVFMEDHITSELLCTQTSTLGTTPKSTYATMVRYFSSYPPAKDSSGNYTNEIACNSSNHPVSMPKGALITSRGTVGSPAITQSIETLVELTPVEGSTNTNAIFAGTFLQTTNSMSFKGNGTPTADVYIGGDGTKKWTCQNDVRIEGDVIAQVDIEMQNSCEITGNVWTKGNVTMSNSAKVGGNLTSSSGTIDIKDPAVRVVGNATSGKLCLGCTAVTVGGTVTQNSPQPDPPVQELPVIMWDPTDWTDRGWTIVEFNDDPDGKVTACDKALTAADNNLTIVDKKEVWTYTDKTVLYIKSGMNCELNIKNKTDISLKNDLAFFTRGNINIQNDTTFMRADGLTTNPTMAFYVEWTKCDPGSMTPGIHIQNNTTFIDVNSFFYAPCGIQVNNLLKGPGGQFISGQVELTNNMTFTFIPAQLPTATLTGFKVDIAYKRQVPSPSTP